MTLQDQLYDKLSGEYAAFIDELKTMPPEKIIESAYEKVFKEDILMSFEYDELLEDDQLAALLAMDYPLDALYRNWLDTDVTYMDDLRDTIESFAKLESRRNDRDIGEMPEAPHNAAPTFFEPPTTQAINGELHVGDWVISANNNDFGYLLGTVMEINKLGTPEHNSDNDTDDIYVDFTAFEYPPERVLQIEEHFSNLYRTEKHFDELPLDGVIMAPEMLINITYLSQDERTRMGDLLENCVAYCNCFPGANAPQSDKHSELMARLDKNITNYNESLMDFGKQELIDMAGKIGAMQDVHSYMTTSRGFSDEEVEFYLQFQNPLEVVADAWRDRNADLEDMSFSLDFIFERKEQLLTEYPLISNADELADNSLRRFMDVDLIDFLGKIAEKVIVHYPKDWDIDRDRLFRAAGSHNPEDKRLMWHVSSWGTHSNTERETFIKDTGAYNTWVDYRPSDPDMFGYVVEVTGRRGQTVMGNVFEVGDYYPHSLYVKENALIFTEVSLTYTNDWGVNAGKTIMVPRFEYDNDRNRLMSESGNVFSIEYHPYEAIRSMADLLHDEHSRRMAYPIGSMEAHLNKIADKLAEVREPQAPSVDKKRSIGDRLAAGNEKVKAYKEQKSQDPNTTKHKKEDIIQ